jgi:hypothetical protein
MRLKPLNCALAAIFTAGGFCGATNALADGVAATDSSLTGTTTLSGVTQSSPGPTFTLLTTQTFQDCLCSPYSGFATGDLAASTFGLQAVGDYHGFGTASETFTTTVINNGSTSEAAAFNFDIPGATLIASPLWYGTGGTDGATISATIDVNGRNAFAYSATATGTSPGPGSGEPFGETFAFSSTGSGLSPQTSLFQTNEVEVVTFGDYSSAIALGTLAPGQSEVITYTLTGETFGSIDPAELQYYGGALAQIGDPLNVAGQPLPPPSFGVGPPPTVSAVPEPGTEVMFAGGLALLGGLAARRKRQLR